MELRDIERPATIGDLIDDARYGFRMPDQTRERWASSERIKHQKAMQQAFSQLHEAFPG